MHMQAFLTDACSKWVRTHCSSTEGETKGLAMVEWILACTEEQVEALCDALEELQCLSASVEDADADTQSERAIFGEPGMPAPAHAWQRSRVRALFADELQASIARTALQSECEAQGWSDLGVVAVPDLDWVQLTQSQFAPVAITPKFWIVPSWHDAPAQAELVMQLDPGLAFGTGTHPTTRMCLQWLASDAWQQDLAVLATPVQRAAPRLLDYGCGSGVLAIGAGLLAKAHGYSLDIDAVDLDPAAIEATQTNAQTNGVVLRSGEVEAVEGTYQVVMANILATPLKVLAPLLCARLAPGAHLVLAGILARQAEELMAAYEPWVKLRVTDEQEGWILMTAHLQAGEPQPASHS
jgi:ribosomal protein L11 methyltransferase